MEKEEQIVEKNMFVSTDNDEDIVVEENADERLNLDSFNGTSVINMDFNVDILSTYSKEGRLNLDPSFQRRNVWDPVKKSKFIESLILHLPIPSMLFAENNDKDEYIVIDGKQRLSTIIEFMASDNSGKGFKLKGLEILSELNSYDYKKLKEDPEKLKFYSQLRTQSLKVSIVRNYNERLLYFIFARLNSGSVPLSTQELRHTLYPGVFSEFINKNGTENLFIRKILNIKDGKVDARMRDSELLCRYFAFKLFRDKYNDTVGELLDLTYKSINEKWDYYQSIVEEGIVEFDNSCRTIFGIFGENAFKLFSFESKTYLKFNRLVFDIMVVLFSEQNNREKVKFKEKEFITFYEDMFSNNDFQNAFKPTTSTKEKTKTRFDTLFLEFEKRF